jgi:hypothetical protein
MKKALIFIPLVIIAILMAALYGAIHNQISYTVAPEYFTKFKFVQFGLLGSGVAERVGASIVGVLASWWMGLPLGLILAGVGFIQRDYKRMLAITLISFLVVVVVALLVGLLGLLYGYIQTTTFELNDYGGWFIPEGLEQPRRFLCAGYMHNSSYLGALIALPIAILFQVHAKHRYNKTW